VRACVCAMSSFPSCGQVGPFHLLPGLPGRLGTSCGGMGGGEGSRRKMSHGHIPTLQARRRPRDSSQGKAPPLGVCRGWRPHARRRNVWERAGHDGARTGTETRTETSFLQMLPQKNHFALQHAHVQPASVAFRFVSGARVEARCRRRQARPSRLTGRVSALTLMAGARSRRSFARARERHRCLG
jgi:hypothetical protein